MTKTTKKFVANAGQLSPVVCKNETEALNVALDGVRRRPVVAINSDGNLVVCCRSTAKRNEWKVQGKLYQRNRTAPKTEQAFVIESKAQAKPRAHKTKAAKHLLEVAVSEILGASKGL